MTRLGAAGQLAPACRKSIRFSRHRFSSVKTGGGVSGGKLSARPDQTNFKARMQLESARNCK
jgi:hypothetical protein